MHNNMAVLFSFCIDVDKSDMYMCMPVCVFVFTYTETDRELWTMNWIGRYRGGVLWGL